jgi:hypothetical protein
MPSEMELGNTDDDVELYQDETESAEIDDGDIEDGKPEDDDLLKIGDVVEATLGSLAEEPLEEGNHCD